MSRAEPLTLKRVRVRPVLVPLARPVVAKVGQFEHWPLILIDAETAQGVVGRSYLEPYIAKSARYLVPAIEDLAEALAGKPVAPLDAYGAGRRMLNLIGYEGAAMIAVAGLDMALWDARARAAGLPLAVLLGGAPGPVPAYNSNGLWLTPLEGHEREAAALAAEGGFDAVKLRLGRDALADDLEAIAAVRRALGEDAKIMTDFNQGRTLGSALDRCHALDDRGLVWFEEPIAYNDIAGHARLAADLKTPVQLGENFYGPRGAARSADGERRRLRHARPYENRRGDGVAACGRHCRGLRHPAVQPSLPGVLRASAPGVGNRALAGVAGLGEPGPPRPVARPRRRAACRRRAGGGPGMGRGGGRPLRDVM